MKSHKGRHVLYFMFSLLLYIAVGALFGAWISLSAKLRGSFDAGPGALAVVLLCFYAGILIQTVLHEGGHMIFGLLTGYGFVSFRILRWTWVRLDGKIAVRRYSLPGTLGQCLLSPPEGYDDMADAPYVLYHLGGALVNLIAAVVLMCLTLLIPGLYGRMVCVGLALAGVLLACTNAIPNEPGVLNNDGRNLLELRRSADARRDMHKQLKITALQADGLRLREMPEDLFAVNEESAKVSMISAFVFCVQENLFLDQQMFEEAETLIALLTEQETYLISRIQQALLQTDRLYLRALAGESAAPTKKELKTLKAYRALLPVCRTNYALALAAGETETAEALLAEFERLASNYPYSGDLASERALVELAGERIAS